MSDDGLPKLVRLVAARPPATGERALLERFAQRLDVAALTEQVGRAEVIAECSCGCPSVGLGTPGPALTPEAMETLSETQRRDVVVVLGHAIGRDGREICVTLHIVSGLLEELEVWPATFGGDPRCELPDAGAVRF